MWQTVHGIRVCRGLRLKIVSRTLRVETNRFSVSESRLCFGLVADLFTGLKSTH